MKVEEKVKDLDLKIKEMETKFNTEREDWRERKRKLRIIFDNKQKEIPNSKQSLREKDITGLVGMKTGAGVIDENVSIKGAGDGKGSAGKEVAQVERGPNMRSEETKLKDVGAVTPVEKNSNFNPEKDKKEKVINTNAESNFLINCVFCFFNSLKIIR